MEKVGSARRRREERERADLVQAEVHLWPGRFLLSNDRLDEVHIEETSSSGSPRVNCEPLEISEVAKPNSKRGTHQG